MSHVLEGTIEVLVEFESALDKIKSEAGDAKKQMVKAAGDLAAASKANALSRAHEIAARRLEAARTEAQTQAEAIRNRGEAEMKRFEGTISIRRKEAAELVTSRLLGEGP